MSSAETHAATPTEPDWPSVDVIIGNPPFLGGKKMRTELGDYVDDLFSLYTERVPPEADLVTYWFEKARAQIEQGNAKRAGLLATNSIRGGKNREVLKRIKETGDIFMAHADREWVLDGAAVRVSMVGFDNGCEEEKTLDDEVVVKVNSDLTALVDVTKAVQLQENLNLAYMGVTPGGPFDVDGNIARRMLAENSVNHEVVKPYFNAIDITRRIRDVWTIDFGVDKSEDESQLYEAPYKYVLEIVKPKRMASKQTQREKDKWWIYTRSRPEMRQAIEPLSRYLSTPLVAKHRIFMWIEKEVVPANLLNVIARDDDYFFGVLHSRLHEIWSLRMGTSLEDRPRYTPTTTFETFPFPYAPGKEDTESAAYQAIAAAAKQLHEERDAWLNPQKIQSGKTDAIDHVPTDSIVGTTSMSSAGNTGETRETSMSSAGNKDRTLTNLYNALNVFRGKDTMRIKAVAGDFAPRLDELHNTLDKAVCDAYGWPHEILDDEEEILRSLLALNLERAEK